MTTITSHDNHEFQHEGSSNDIPLEGLEISSSMEQLQHSATISPRLIRPFAIVIFFHQVVKIHFKDLNEYITHWNQKKDLPISNKIYDSFKTLQLNINIHKQHEILGLYPEINDLITQKLRNKDFSLQNKSQLESDLDTITTLSHQHETNTQTMTHIKKQLSKFLQQLRKTQHKPKKTKSKPSISSPHPQTTGGCINVTTANKQIPASKKINSSKSKARSSIRKLREKLNFNKHKSKSTTSANRQVEKQVFSYVEKPVKKPINKSTKKRKSNSHFISENTKRFQNITTKIECWMDSYLDHIENEETLYRQYLDQIGSEQIPSILLGKGILDLNRELISHHQFGFVLTALSQLKEWICPITDQSYKGTDILVAYLHCLQLESDEEEYSLLIEDIELYIKPEIWSALKLYGLHEPGMFQYRPSSVQRANINFHVIDGDIGCCDSRCPIL
eukprot:121904_1